VKIKKIQLGTFARRPHANPTAVAILGADPPDIISAPLLAKEAKLKRGVNEHPGQRVLLLSFRIAT